MKILLQTPRLVLREFVASDAELLVGLDSDPEVMRFISNGLPTPRDQIVAEHIPAYLEYHRRSPHFGFWVAQRPDSGEFLGWFHLRPESTAPATEPELGYRLGRAGWGQGLATEGSIALINHAFENTPATRVTANTMLIHTASRRVMEKAGMHLSREYTSGWPVHIDGDEFGDVEYEVTRESWLAARA